MSNSKTLLYIILGIIFWFVAAMIVRFGGSAIFSEGNPLLTIMFLVTFPVTAIFLWVTMKIGKLKQNELLKPIVIITAAAAAFDGIAMTWFRQLYSNSFEVAFYGSALILWGVSLGLIFSYILSTSKIK